VHVGKTRSTARQPEQLATPPQQRRDPQRDVPTAHNENSFHGEIMR